MRILLTFLCTFRMELVRRMSLSIDILSLVIVWRSTFEQAVTMSREFHFHNCQGLKGKMLIEILRNIWAKKAVLLETEGKFIVIALN